VADDDRCAGAGKAGSEVAFSLRNTCFRWLGRGDRKLSARGRKDFRKPMLYPLSYEGQSAASPSPKPTVPTLVRGFGWAA